MRAVACSVVLALLAGCQYGPLDLQENQPQISDAFIERDFVVEGTSVLRFFENDEGDFGEFLCTVEQEVQGWRADDLNDASCVGCDEIYTLSMRGSDGEECDVGGAASVDVAFTPLEFFEQVSDDDSFWNWLNENDADSFANTTWYPRGPTSWEPRLGVFRPESPDNPFGDGAWDCGARWCMETRYWYGTADWYAKWWLALDLIE